MSMRDLELWVHLFSSVGCCGVYPSAPHVPSPTGVARGELDDDPHITSSKRMPNFKQQTNTAWNTRTHV